MLIKVAWLENLQTLLEGYVFAGWYLHGELYEFNTPVNSNIVLIAKWLENKKVRI